MEESDLPSRLFETGCEPTGKKRVNNYFNLRWIEVIKSALEDEDLEMLSTSQFGQVLRMGAHTFSVMFLHYILARQLVTDKDFELWWLLVGKPIRYAIQDFALVTGLNCGPIVDVHLKRKGKGARGKAVAKSKSSTASPSIWDVLFGREEKPTTSWIIDRLVKGKKYKDPLTRLRLSLLVLVEGILCPTCGITNIRPEVVRMLDNVDEFLNYPWGRESFLLTVQSTKARPPSHYVLQDTMAIQGFSHAMVLVTVAACPSILLRPGAVMSVENESKSSYDIIQELLDRKFSVNVEAAKGVDQKGQALVRSLITTDEAGEELYRGLEDKEDESVDHLLVLIHDDYPFEHNTWTGGVKADDVMVNKGNTPVTESTDQQESEDMDNECGHQVCGDDGVQSRGRRGQPSMRQDDAHIGGQFPSSSVASMVRQAAEAYEAQLLPMLEGYMVSMKDHISHEVSKIMNAIAATNASVAALDTFVKTEFASLRKESTGVDMYGGDLLSGYSPGRPSSSQPPSFLSRQPPQGTSDIIGDVHVPTRGDGLGGNAAMGEKYAPCDMPADDLESGRPHKLSEEIEPGPMARAFPGVEVHVAANGANTVESTIPEDATTVSQPPGPVEVNLEKSAPCDMEADDLESGRPHEVFETKLPADVSQPNTEPAAESSVESIPTQLTLSSSTLQSTTQFAPSSVPLSDIEPPASEVVSVPTNVSDSHTGQSAVSIVNAVLTQLQGSACQLDISGITSDTLHASEPTSVGAMSGVVPADNVGSRMEPLKLPQQLVSHSSSQGNIVPPSSTPTIVPMLQGEEDAGRGLEVSKGDQVLTNKKTVIPTKTARAVKLPSAGPPDGFKRYSKRERHSPDRYIPGEAPKKQEPVKRTRRAPKEKEKETEKEKEKAKDTEKEKEKVVSCVSKATFTITETTSLIGGFTPFLPPNPVKRDAFVQAMTVAKNQSSGKVPFIEVDTLLPVFDCSRVASEKAIDRVVAFIRKRRDGLPRTRFEFLDASFFTALLSDFPDFTSCSSKSAFSFSPPLARGFLNRPQWFTQVDVVHIPVLVKKTHWVGVIVDLTMWEMSVVSGNTSCPPENDIRSLLTQAAILLPYVIGRYCMSSHAQKRNFEPMSISRLDTPSLVEHPGCSAVVALMLLELHAVGKDLNIVQFTEAHARTAAENYAVETLHMSSAVSPPPAQ